MKFSTSIRYYLLAIVLLLVAAILWADVARRVFKAGEIKNPSIAGTAGTEGNDTSAWNLFFERKVPTKDHFNVIADKNVFSASRKAWTPPQAQEEAKPETAAQNKTEEIVSKRDDVELRGTAMVEQKRKAILHFKSFRSVKTFRLGEGDVASEKDQKGGPSFTVLSIASDTVRMKDNAGKEFVVGLYDHKREGPATTVNQSKIVEAQAPSPPPQAPAPAPSSVVVGTPTNANQEGISSKTDAQRQKNEQLVKEGKMKKIETPFGSVYRKQ